MSNALIEMLRKIGGRTVDDDPGHEKCLVFRGGIKNPGLRDAVEKELEISFTDEYEKNRFLETAREVLGQDVTPAAQKRIEFNYTWTRTSPEVVLIRGEVAGALERLVRENNIPHKAECAKSRNFPETYPPSRQGGIAH